MQEFNKEKGSPEQENAKIISWEKVFSWTSLLLSTMVPVASIGAAIVSISLDINSDISETKVLNYISIGIATFMLLNEFLLKILMF